MHGTYRLAACASVAAALVLAACSGDSSNTGDATPSASVEATSAAAVTPVAATPSTTGPARVRTSIEASCRLADSGSEITVTYAATAEGSAQLSRIRFIVDGRLSEETGPTPERDFRRSATIKVPDGTTHVLQVTAQAGSSVSSTSMTTVRCATPTRGPTL